MVRGHQRGGGARGQRGGAFGVGAGGGQQTVDDGVGMRHAMHDDQRVDAFAAGLEGAVGCRGLVKRRGRQAPALDLVRAL